eukprot:608557-Prymnesium_polylepis.1
MDHRSMPFSPRVLCDPGMCNYMYAHAPASPKGAALSARGGARAVAPGRGRAAATRRTANVHRPPSPMYTLITFCIL